MSKVSEPITHSQWSLDQLPRIWLLPNGRVPRFTSPSRRGELTTQQRGTYQSFASEA